MKVLLNATIDGIGRAGEICSVPDGYARNYLFPKKLAQSATAAAIASAAQQQQKRDRERTAHESEMAKLSQKLESEKVSLWLPANDQGRLFGGVNRKMIGDALNNIHASLSAANVELDRPIDQIGEHRVALRLGKRNAYITIDVQPKP